MSQYNPGIFRNSTRAALDKLETIGSVSGAESIARFLSDRNITGVVGDAMTCPIAEYLLAETGVTHVVGMGEAKAHTNGYYNPHIGSNHRIGPNVGAFIVRFDSGAFPFLRREAISVRPQGVAPHESPVWGAAA